MAWFLRKVKWNRWQERAVDPLCAYTALPPDPLGDVSTTRRILSLWEVSEDRANLDRIIALLAATVQAPAECAFVIFPATQLVDLELQATKIDGNSPDAAANLKWHFDLHVASADHLVRFARFLLSQGELARRNPTEVKKLLHQGVEKKELNPEKMDPRLREKLFPKQT
jgi:hypothetical protein